MFDRVGFKENGKLLLRRNYWTPFLVCLVAGLLGGSSGFSSSAGGNAGNVYSGGSYNGSIDLDGTTALVVIIAIIVALVVLAISLAIVFFLQYPISVGKHRFFMENRERVTDFNVLFYGYRNGRLKGIIKGMWAVSWRVFLWSLLLVVPGIIKSYEYRMVPYILAENPEIDTLRALEISREMTQGDKLNLWIMDLSFIGWYLLGTLACCVGTLFVTPYVETSFAECYQYMREKALTEQFATAIELPGFALSE
ncbi:MAG: DUF975 family protein [Oscillospiraceae bacterium]|nr:DUF975 family protein [Oscillospiraceae bacterium]